MKTFMVVIVMLLTLFTLITLASADPNYPGYSAASPPVYSIGGSTQIIQASVPDPTKSFVTSSMTGTKVFKFGTGADFNITGYYALIVNSAAAGTYYYNSDSTKTFSVPAGVTTTIYVWRKNISQVTVTFGAGTNYVQGM